MIDLDNLKRIVAKGDSSDQVKVTRRFLSQAVREIEAGRNALAEVQHTQSLTGLLFGLPRGTRL